MRKKSVSILLLLLLLTTTLTGCFVWTYVKGEYQDFTAYFNTFYNAQDAYTKGMQDVKLAMKERDVLIISGARPTPFAISGNAKQDFDVAIEKASKVLQYYPTSGYTQDCLFMIGISYYYEGDDNRGGRKFIEIESTFPNTGRYSEALAYYGGILLRERADGAYDTLTKSLTLARSEKNWNVAAFASQKLSDFYLAQDDSLNAAAYLDTASVLASGDDAAIYACYAGDMFADHHNYRRALASYDRAWNTARDIRLLFYSRYYTACVLRMQKNYYLALDNLSDIRDDDKYFQYFPLIDYQEAQVLYDSGAVSKAVTSFLNIDTAYTSNEAATRAAFELGNTYLYKIGDYPTALKYYQRCASHPLVFDITPKAQQLASLLQEYFIDSYRTLIADSLFNRMTEATEKNDTTLLRGAVPLDTLYERAAEAQQSLAGFFMFKLEISDSAIVHFKEIVRDFRRSKVYPSALYTLGESYYSEGDTASGISYLDTLLAEHPESEYAVPASSLLKREFHQEVDSSQQSFDSAVTLMNKGGYDDAIARLRAISSIPKSKFAPQALYTIGWIYEQKLNEPDSAVTYYKLVSLRYPTSEFTVDVKLALTGYEEAERDSAAARQRAKNPEEPTHKPEVARDSTLSGFKTLQERNRVLDSLRTAREFSIRSKPDSIEVKRERIVK